MVRSWSSSADDVVAKKEKGKEMALTVEEFSLHSPTYSEFGKIKTTPTRGKNQNGKSCHAYLANHGLLRRGGSLLFLLAHHGDTVLDP